MEKFVRLKSGEIGVRGSGNVVKAEAYAEYIGAKAMFADAALEKDRIREEATGLREQERLRGYEEGVQEAKLEMAEQMIDVVSGTVDYLAKIEKEVIEVVTRSLERILGEIDDDELIVRIVRDSLHAVRNQKQLTLRVAPEQLQAVKARVDEILADFPAIVDLQVTGDSRLSKTGCILESEIGIIDASLEGQLATIRKSFEKTLGDR